MELVDNKVLTMENSHSDSGVHTAPTEARRGGPPNAENSKIFCWFFPSVFFLQKEAFWTPVMESWTNFVNNYTDPKYREAEDPIRLFMIPHSGF
jgi:hypothetical protein